MRTKPIDTPMQEIAYACALSNLIQSPSQYVLSHQVGHTMFQNLWIAKNRSYKVQAPRYSSKYLCTQPNRISQRQFTKLLTGYGNYHIKIAW